jgi:hypothetical protein
MIKTYTYTKKQASELLNISPAKVDVLAKKGILTRVRKNTNNDRSAWLYSAEELGMMLANNKKDEEVVVPAPTVSNVSEIRPATSKAKNPFWKFWK